MTGLLLGISLPQTDRTASVPELSIQYKKENTQREQN